LEWAIRHGIQQLLEAIFGANGVNQVDDAIGIRDAKVGERATAESGVVKVEYGQFQTIRSMAVRTRGLLDLAGLSPCGQTLHILRIFIPCRRNAVWRWTGSGKEETGPDEAPEERRANP
jgi:hypothetical protein